MDSLGGYGLFHVKHSRNRYKLFRFEILCRIINVYSRRRHAGKTCCFIDEAGKAATAAKLAIGALGYGAGLSFTISGRESETAQEAINAQADRIYRSLKPNGIDFASLRPEIINNARQHGLEVSQLDDNELLGVVLALNIKTSNPTFNEVVK